MLCDIFKRPNLFFAMLCFCIFSATFLKADIVFLSDRDGSPRTYECDVYTMDDNGGNVHRLTKDSLYKFSPAWSPNGSQIAFGVEVMKPHHKDWGPDQTVELFLINAEGYHKKQLTDYKVLSLDPTWSPDGRSIAFTSNQAGNFEIHRMDLATGRFRQLTNSLAETGGSASSPDWSPDGRKIAYSLTLPGAGTHIYIINAEGRKPRPLVKPKKLQKGITNFSGGAKWHPDSEHILYRTASVGIVQKVFQIVDKGGLVIRREGSEASQYLKIPQGLTFRTGCWAEAGKAVIFYASEDDDPSSPTDIYRYDLFTHEVVNISNHPGKDFSPHWVDPTFPVSSLDILATQWARIKRKL